jgi:hypothetical protein
MRYLTSIAACCLAPALCGAAPTMYPLPEGAIRPAHVVLHDNRGEQDFFWLEAKFPSTAALDHYGRLFSDWRPCYATERNWWSFADRSRGDGEFIHQLSRHWVNGTNDTSVTLVLKYSSAGAESRIAPATDSQFVVLVRQRRPNAAKRLEEVGVTCATDT